MEDSIRGSRGIMFKLISIELINFRSWEYFKLDNIDSRGLTLIGGANGSGKSSIRQAIEYLIVDKISDGISVEDIPRDKNTWCTIAGIIKRGDDTITITKYRNHKKHGNSVIVDIDGDKSLTATDRRETVKNIRELFGISDDTLFISTIFTKNSPSFPEAKDTARKEILYEIVNLNKWKEREEKAKYEVKVLEVDILDLQSDKTLLFEKIKSTHETIEDYEIKEKLFKKEVFKKTAVLLKNREELEHEPTDRFYTKLKKLEDSIVIPEFDAYEMLKQESLKLQTALSDHSAKISLLEQEIENVGDGNCPVLGHVCTELMSNIDAARDKIEPQIEGLKKECKTLLDQFSMVEQQMYNIDEDIRANDKIERDINTIMIEINKIEDRNKYIDKKKEDIDNRIKELSKEENPYTELIDDLYKKKTEFVVELDRLIKEIEEKEELYKYYKFWVKGYSRLGIPNILAESVLEKIECKTNEILSAISNDMYVSIKGQSETSSGDTREKISYDVYSKGKTITDFNSYSGGEKQRVQVADIFSFNSIAGKFNFMFLDEVLEMSLDEQGRGHVIDILKENAKNLDSLFVISHTDEIKDRFYNTINVKKKDGVSMV